MLLSLSGGSGVVLWVSAGTESCLGVSIWLLCVPLCSCPSLLFFLPKSTALQSHGLWLLTLCLGSSKASLSTLYFLFPKGTFGNEQGRASQRHLSWVVSTHIILDFQATNLLEPPVLDELPGKNLLSQPCWQRGGKSACAPGFCWSKEGLHGTSLTLNTVEVKSHPCSFVLTPRVWQGGLPDSYTWGPGC